MVGLSAQIEWNTGLGDDALLSKRGVRWLKACD
jgi:hypothetical protein